MGKVIKGRKYILAGNFPAEHKQNFIDTLTNELGIEIVAVITSDNTCFIEYEPEDTINFIQTIERQNVDIKKLKTKLNKKWF